MDVLSGTDVMMCRFLFVFLKLPIIERHAVLVYTNRISRN